MPDPTAPRPNVPDDLIDAVSNRLYSFTVTDPEDREHLAQVLAAAMPEVRERVAAEQRAAAQAIDDSRGENRDALAEEIWQTCRQEFYATCDDPRTIAAVAYRHIAARIARGES